MESELEDQCKQLQPYLKLLTSVLSESAMKINALVWIVPVVINTGHFDWRDLQIFDGAMYAEGAPGRPFLALIRDADNYFVEYGRINNYDLLNPVI